MPTTPENGRPAATTPEASKTPAQVTAEDLHNSLVAMVENQKAEVMPEVNPAPGSVTAPEPLAPLPGRFEASGAAAGSKVDALVDRGSSAVTVGKEKVGEKVDGAALKAYELAGKVDSGVKSAKERAAGIRERVKNGAEVAAEKKREAVRSAKEKSQKALLVTIGLSITVVEGVTGAPEKIKNRGRKIADRLNKWCAKAKESFSGMKDNVKDRVAEGIGKVVEKTVEKIDTAGQNWEARLQEARKEAEAAAEKAELESWRENYAKFKIAKTAELAKKTRDAEVDEATKVADRKEAATNSAAELDAMKETIGKTIDDIKKMMEAIALGDGAAETVPDTGVTVEKPTEVVPDASEPVPIRPVTPDVATTAPETAAA